MQRFSFARLLVVSLCGGVGACGSGEEAAPAKADASPASGFAKGHVFVAGSRDAEVFEFDETLALVTRWTHPSFGTVPPAPGQAPGDGPAGMAFDAIGNLVVAGAESFCVFSAPGVVVACHPKVKKQATENILFDTEGNLYTTAGTAAEVHKYTRDYAFVKTFTLPSGRDLSGITCDTKGDLLVGGRMDGGVGVIFHVDKNTLGAIASIPVLGGTVEGLQYIDGGSVWAALHGTVAQIPLAEPYNPTQRLSDPGLARAVPITIDEAGNAYTADAENDAGTEPADLYVFAPDGKLKTSRKASEVHGPFGIVVAGTRLPCGAYRPK